MKLPAFEFYYRLSRREQALLLIVAGAVFVILNLVALRTLATSFRDLNAQRRSKAFDVQTLQVYRQDKPRWEQRMRWLKEKQPPLTNRDVAGVKLEEQVKTLADAQKVIISNQQILPAAAGLAALTPSYQSVTVQFDAKADWVGTFKFLESAQRPENFTAFESASLRVDPSDQKMMKGQFRIAKWFTPSAQTR